MRIDDQQLKALQTRLETLREAAEQLLAAAADFPAVACNTRRILASLTVLQMNVEEVVDQAD